MEYPGAESRRLVVHRIQRVAGPEGHSHVVAGHMGVARAAHGIRGVEEVARRKELPAEEAHRSGLAGVEDNDPVEAGDSGLAGEGHHRAADSPPEAGLVVRIGVRILHTEVLLTELAPAKTGDVFEMPLTVRLIRHGRLRLVVCRSKKVRAEGWAVYMSAARLECGAVMWGRSQPCRLSRIVDVCQSLRVEAVSYSGFDPVGSN